MLLDNQLLVRERSTQRCRMCGNVVEVCQFIYELKGYQLTDIEYKGLNDFMKSVLPLRDFSPMEKRRTLIIVSPDGDVSELAYKDMEGVSKEEAVPEGYRMLGQIFAAAYTANAQSVARFDFGDERHPITINLSRKSSVESLPFSLARELWAQQISHFENPLVPNVKADLSKYKPSADYPVDKDFTGYTLRAGDDSFVVNNERDFLAAVHILLREEPSAAMVSFANDIFSHLEQFPKACAFSPTVDFYSNHLGGVYVGGNGSSNKRRLVYAGKFYPSFFTGLSGNVLTLKMGVFEDVMINILLVRN